MDVLEKLVKPTERIDGALRRGNLVVQPSASDVILAHAYLRFRADGQLEQIFSEGIPSLTWFLQHYGQAQVLSCFIEESSRMDLVGLGWLNTLTEAGPQNRKADCGMAFFRGVRHEKMMFGQMMLEWAFEDAGLSVLYGTTPAPHRRALMFSQMLGFKLIGPLPEYTLWEGQPCAAWISCLTKEQWQSSARRTEKNKGVSHGWK
jgi:hypothetical protein